MDRMGVDIHGPFPLTDNGKRYVLVAMEDFLKWPFAVSDQTSSSRQLVQELFSRFGATEELHVDQGRNFEAQVFQDFDWG